VPSSGSAGRAHFLAKRIRPWTVPAGFNYGKLFGVKELAINPNQRQRDILYRNFFNPIVDYPRDGVAIYGQKTFSRTESAFDRLNVRNLFLHLEKQVSNTLNQFVFEPNTIPTRNRVVLGLTPFFETAKRYEGLYDYRLICDERNNTPDVIDNNELRLAVYIQPVRAAEFILADFVATRTGTDLDELVGN
jgi:phage tail sheath protein FI